MALNGLNSALDLGGGNVSNKVKSTTYNNVDIIGNNINIKTGNNTDIKGANIMAQTNENNVGGNINMDIGNNLNIESLQDTYYAKSKSSNFRISAGGGKNKDGGANGNAGFNIGKTDSTTDSQWVNEQTSIIADNNVNIRTNNNTNLIGSVVASNSDNLSLNTRSLTYSDLNDFYREETKGYNFGTSVVGNRTDQKETNLHPQGSTTIGLIHTGQEKEQITRATIGLGNITINSEPLTPTPLPQGARDVLAGLNRNVNNSQEITKDIITGALNASMTIDNRLLMGFMSVGKEVVKDKDGKPIQKGVDKDGNPIYETRDVSGFQSIGSDFKNFGDNFTGALVGATGSVINTIKTTYDTITDTNSSITDVAKNWKTGQNSLATSIMRGTDDKTKDIMEKINKGTATPEELQYVSNMVSKDGDGNIIFTSDGKSIIVKDADGRIGEQLGFNDKTTGQGYVDAGKTATDDKTFMKVDAEERIHKNIESESVAKNMANREVGYYNTISFLTGGKGLAVSNATNGGLNSQMQSNWNQQYNTSTSSLLANNTSIASNVNDKLYSVFVDEKGKILKVTDNNNYNAYLVGKGTTREDIEKDPEKYENENNMVLYSDLFLKGEKLSGDDLTLAEKSFNNPEVHNELLLLDSFDKNKSISDNIYDLLDNEKIDIQTAIVLKRALDNGADDFSLSYLMANNLWSGIADNSYGISNPTNTIMNAFNIDVESRITINPSIGQDNRTFENGTCATSGCGQFGAPRNGRSIPHQGTDYLISPDGYVVATNDGILYRAESNRKNPEKSLPSYLINNKDTGVWNFVLYNNIDLNIKNGTNVKQGDVIGKPISQSDFDRVYNTIKDKDGNVIKTLKPGDKGYTPLHLHNETKINKERKDNLPIVFPNKVPEKLLNK